MARWRSLFVFLTCIAGALLCVGSAAPRTQTADPALPSWIREISPHGTVDTLAQIRVLFVDPVIPLEAVESPDRQTKLHFFHIQPALPGHFIFLTPRMVGFQMDRALPLATHITVTLDRGLGDLNGHTLASDLSWSFETTPIKIETFPNTSGISLDPSIVLVSNTQLDIDSLRHHTTLTGAGGDVALDIRFDKDESYWGTWPGTIFDPSLRQWYYAVKVRQALAKSTDYAFTVARGVRPAGGNMPSASDFSSSFRTYDPLKFEGLDVSGQSLILGTRYGDLSLELVFNNSLDPKTALDHISISPKPSGPDPVFQPLRSDRGVDIVVDRLEPRTTYTFTMDPGVTDTFGQALGRREVATYTTSDLNPDFWSISGYHIFAPALGIRLNLIARNLPNGVYQAAYRSLNPLDVGDEDASNLLPDRAAWPDVHLQIPPNRTEDVTLPMGQFLHGRNGVLAYGLGAKFPGYDEGELWGWNGGHPVPVYGLAQVTDLGLYVQETPDAGFVRTQSLNTGEAVGGASIDVYAWEGGKQPKFAPTPCASATTDPLGSALLTGADWLRCVKSTPNSWGAPPLLVVARTVSDWTFVRTDTGAALGSGWERGPSSRGALYSDRDLYQPGETVQFTGIAYYEEAGSIHRDSNSRYSLTLQSQDGSTSPLGTTTTDEYGAFAIRVPLKASQTVGYYRVSAKDSRGLQIDGQFTVAQFTPPNFEVHLSLDKAVAFQGETVGLESASKYLFGVPLSNAKTAFHATRSQTQFAPPGWDGYSFGRTWWWIDTPPALDGRALDVTSQVDSQGRARASIDVPADLPYPVLYAVDATTTDVSNRSVADSGSFVALPSDALIGVQGPWLGRVGKPISIRTIVVDHNGKTLAGRGVTAVLARVAYGDEVGSTPHYVTVDTQTVTSSSAAVALSLTAPSAGTYRVQANFAGSTNGATATDTLVWVSGPGEVDWGADGNSGLTIRLDKKKYHAGDTATAIVEAPFAPADLYFTVVKHGLLYHTVVPVDGSAPEVQFTVTPQMLPNSEIEAVLVRKGTPLSKTTAKTQADIVRYGSAALAQDLDDRYLHVAATPVHATIEPGKPQTLAFAVTDIHGRPARAEIAVMVVNDDILQLTGYRPPDLVTDVYAGHQISSVVVDDRAAMLFAQPDEASYQYPRRGLVLGEVTSDTYSVLSKSMSNAPSAAPAARSVYLRTNFKKLAYYDLAVRTDANGKASVTFKMPDDLTRWRVFAEASGAVEGGDDAGYRFGYGESTFVATKPLLTNPLLPQFARPGDVFDGGLSVTSATGATGMLSIEGALNGPLSFGGGHAVNSLDVAMRSGTQAFRFPITVSKVAPATIQFTTLLGQESDAFRVPLALTPLEITEQVIDSGATTTGARIPLRVDPNVDVRAGGLQLSFASTLLPQITVPAEQMLAEPCLPFLTEAAAQLSAAADMQIIADRYGQRFPTLDLRAIAARNLEVFEKLQRTDSGFADWPGSTWHDPYANAYAAEALGRAQRAGFPVAPSFIDSSKTILRAIERDPVPFAPLCDEPCLESIRLHALVGLAALGETHTEDLPAVYAQADRFGYVDRLMLARYLSAIPAWKTQAGALAVKLAETIYETGRYATVNQSDSWWWWSGTESQAQAIRLYSSRPASADFRDRLVRGLLAQRRKGAWSNTFDTAEALDALVDYLALEASPPKFDATASVAGRTVVATRFEGYREPLRETNIGMTSLPHGRSNVDLQKTGTGTLHYVIAYRYRLQGAQPGAMEGIRIDRKLHPVNAQSVLSTVGVAVQKKPLTLPPGQVYDVELVIVADHPLDQVVITDPLPAGMEAIDSSFKTATPYFQPLASAWNIDYTQIYRDRVLAFADRLGPGVYSFHYLVRTVTPGTFLWPGADAHLEFAPEQFGRTASSTLRVSM